MLEGFFGGLTYEHACNNKKHVFIRCRHHDQQPNFLILLLTNKGNITREKKLKQNYMYKAFNNHR